MCRSLPCNGTGKRPRMRFASRCKRRKKEEKRESRRAARKIDARYRSLASILPLSHSHTRARAHTHPSARAHYRVGDERVSRAYIEKLSTPNFQRWKMCAWLDARGHRRRRRRHRFYDDCMSMSFFSFSQCLAFAVIPSVRAYTRITKTSIHHANNTRGRKRGENRETKRRNRIVEVRETLTQAVHLLRSGAEHTSQHFFLLCCFSFGPKRKKKQPERLSDRERERKWKRKNNNNDEVKIYLLPSGNPCCILM